ncbi:MAG TPA: transporter [Lachnospiraceae bacterium]|nr:transporter [Lachnospiraceae bacterium]
MEKKTATFITHAAAIAAIYVVLTLVFAPISYGEVQVRVSEALTILPFFTPAAIPGLFIGCIIANATGRSVILDIVFGSIATLIGAFGTYKLRKNRWLAPLPPIIANTVIVPLVLRYGYGVPLPLPMLMVFIAIGEIISCYVMGELLLTVLLKYRNVIFNSQPAHN